MSQDKMTWAEYYQKIKGRAPRQLLLDVLEKYPSGESLHAIDLGCGDGTESVLLLERGWNVLAIDGEPAAIEHLMSKVPAGHLPRLQTQVAKFKDVLLPPADLLYAFATLPFCKPEHFDSFWKKIVDAVKPGGRFAGQFFGVRDTWAGNPEMTFHTEKQVRDMLNGFEVESFQEIDEDGNSASGPKHWHAFNVIVRKK